MATTQIAAIWTPEVAASYKTLDALEKTAIADSGVLTTTEEMQQLLNSRLPDITLPYWNDLDASIEPNYSTDNPADIAVPLAVTTGEMKAYIANVNEGWSSASLVRELTAKDPLADLVRGRINPYWRKQAQRRLIASLIGVYRENVANGDSDMIITDAANGLNADVIIDAEASMGDNLDKLGIIIMHSKKYADLQKQNLIEFIVNSEANTRFAVYQNKRVVVDDGMPNLGTALAPQYLTMVAGAGAIGYAYGQPYNAETVAYVDDQANGGGVETLWSRRKFIIHPLGYSFTATTITGNGTEQKAFAPSWGDLALAANWERVVNRKAVPIAFIVTK